MAAKRGRTISNMTHLFGGLSGGSAILIVFAGTGTIEKPNRVGTILAGLTGTIERPNRVGSIVTDRHGDS